LYGDNLPAGQRKIPRRLLKNDENIKFQLYSLKVSANVKIAMQCFENFGKCPPWLRACVVLQLASDSFSVILKAII